MAEEQAHEAGLPSFEEELWRYTPIADLDVSKYQLGAPGGSLYESGLTPVSYTHLTLPTKA